MRPSKGPLHGRKDVRSAAYFPRGNRPGTRDARYIDRGAQDALLNERKNITPELLDIVVCPVCKGTLAFEDERLFTCGGCGERYEVIEDVPVLLPAQERRADVHCMPDHLGPRSCPGKNAPPAPPSDLGLEFLRMLGVKGRFLDLGCANGAGVLKAEVLGAKGFGLDYDLPPLIAGIRNRDAHNIVAGSAAMIPFRKGIFDWIFCNQVIEHIRPHQLDNMLAEIFRVLAEGGKLYCSTVNRLLYLKSVLRRPYRIKSWKGLFGTPSEHLHFQEWFPWKFKSLFVKAGFKAVKLKYFPGISLKLSSWKLYYPGMAVICEK